MKTSRSHLTIAAAATGALLASGGAPALGAPHAPHARSALVETPSFDITMSKGTDMKVVGPASVSAGRIKLTLHAKKGEQEIAVMRLHKGYTMAELNRDFAKFGASEDQPTPKGLKALRRVVRHTTFYGGLDSGAGHTTVSGTVVLPKAGTYYFLDDSNGGPGTGGPPTKLKVTPKAGSRDAVAVSAHVTAVNAHRFRGSTNLPASGTIEFTNKATNSPHFLFLQHVKAGTTRKQVIKGFQCEGPKCRGPFLEGGLGTDVVHMGKSQTLTYSLPAGDYVEVCFFPDLKTGMSHAFMGMVRIVHLS
jgi:hypothetical protein